MPTKSTSKNTDKLADFTAGSNPLPRGFRISLVWQAFKGFRLLYLAGLVAMIFEAFFTFAGPMVIKVSIDSVIGLAKPTVPAPLNLPAKVLLGPEYSGGGLLNLGETKNAAPSGEWRFRGFLRANPWVLGLVFLSAYLFQAFFGFLSGYCANKSAEEFAKRLRDRLHEHVQDLPWETLLRAHTGDWQQRCTSDVDTTRRFVGMQVFEMVRTFVLIAIALPVMLGLSTSLTAWGSLVIPIIVIFSVVFFQKVQKAFLKVDQQEGALASIIQENITGVRVVRAFARQEYETKRFSESNASFRDKVYKLIVYLAWYWGVSSALGLLQLGLVLAVGAGMVQAGALSLGVLVLFLSYEQQLLWPIRQFGRLLADSGKVGVALGRMAELLSLRKEDDNGTPAPLDADIVFDQVDFTYPDGTEVLHKVSFTLKKGSHLAILGPTGSGKTSLVHLLARLYEPSSGSIRIGDRELNTISKSYLRKHMAMVLQEGFIFGTSINANISLGKHGASTVDIESAAGHASFHQVALEQTEGYETTIGERGVSLSGGQRQRLALSRALVRDADLLILDDSLSAVDTETDAHIRKNLRRHKSTAIIIAHRMTTLSSADQILVLEHGRVSALGTHKELLAEEGLYRRLNLLQSELEGSM